MKTQIDFKKEWEKTKKQLVQLGQESSGIARRVEKELVKLSQKGKLQVDATAVTLKKERLYYLVGREYVAFKNSGRENPKLDQLLEELKNLDKQQRSLKTKIKSVK